MIKVNTIEQFKVLQHIQENFYPDKITIEIVDEKALKVTDTNKDSLIFRWDGNKVISEKD